MTTLGADDRGLILTCAQCGQNNRLPYARIGQPPRCAKCGTPLPPPNAPVEIETDASFAALTANSALPVLVDFWAAWCGPCKMIAPEVAKVAPQGAGRWVVAKLNTELLPGSARQFAVTSIPLLILFRHGRELARQAGAMPAASILQFVQRHI
jgi:thioredoxin 2